jgi:hypothetical protein
MNTTAMSTPQPHLFESEHDRTVRDMITEFERQLATATTPLERAELRLAIASWKQQLDPPAPCKAPRRKAAKR